VLSHDLRNPLGAMLTSAKLLIGRDDLDDQCAKAASAILNSGNRMQQLINDLLDVTRTRLGPGLQITRTPTDLAGVCRQTIEEAEAFHPDRMLLFECRGDLEGRWDMGRIIQMLSNLVGNAIQHGETDTPISVTALGAADEVLLAVHNLGAAIAPEARQKISDMLINGSLPQRQQYSPSGSLGLGLYIARQIAVAHGGSINMASSTEHGTTFTVRLPRH
jgi:signal transduction histidine kinase